MAGSGWDKVAAHGAAVASGGAIGFHDEAQAMSVPAMSGVGGPVNHAASSAAFAHHAADAKTYSETPPIKLGKAEPNMTPAPKKYDYSKDKSGPEPPPPESTRRLNDMLRDEGPNMSEAPPAPLPKHQPPAKCGIDVSCAPHERSLGEQLKIGVGKVWSGVSKVLGGGSEPAAPPRMPAVGPDGRYTDRYEDGTPVEKAAVPGGGVRG